MITLENSKHSPRNLNILDLQELGTAIRPQETLHLLHADRHLLARNLRARLIRSFPDLQCQIIRYANSGRPDACLELREAMDRGAGTFVALGQAGLGILAELARTRDQAVCGLLADGPVSPGVLGLLSGCAGTGKALLVMDHSVPCSFQRSGTGAEFFACLGECLALLGFDAMETEEEFAPALEALADLAGAYGAETGESQESGGPSLGELGLKAAWFFAGRENPGLADFRLLCTTLGRILDRDDRNLAGVVLPAWIAACTGEDRQKRLARIMTRIWGLEWGEDQVRIDEGASRLSLLAGSLELPNRARDLRIISKDVWDQAVMEACKDTRLAEGLKSAW